MLMLKIALRNILRNRRRSLMTIAAVAVGAIAVLVMGSFMARIMIGFQTSTVERTGHLSVFRAGYFDFGSGNPGAYGITDYPAVIAMIRDDPVIAPLAELVTPTVTLFGIAGNFAMDTSKSFFGTGFLPADRDRMLLWDEYRVMDEKWRARASLGSGLVADDPTQGVVGRGLARILGLCAALAMENCPPLPPSVADGELKAVPVVPAIAELAAREAGQPDDRSPRLDLLAATAAGAPNVVGVTVRRADSMGMKELDDNFVGLHLALAQQLVYGRGPAKANALVVLLHRSEDMAVVRRRLQVLFASHQLDFEVHDFTELTPMYTQTLAMFSSMFLFVAVIMGVIVLFTMINTLGMTVMERVNEIGTSRALGARRQTIRRQFLAEGALLGLIGASVGIVLAIVIALLFNRSGATWTPPGSAAPIALRLMIGGLEPLALGTWLALIVIATLAALVPANLAARLKVVDALRHI